MKNKNTLLAAGLAFAALSTPALAEIKGVAHLGYEFGGDNILNARYTDGSSSTIDAGDGLLVSGGIAYLFNEQFALQTTIGWKYQTIQQADNGGADFTRFPLEALLQYTFSKVRMGGGVTRHLSPKLSTDGVLKPYGASFDDATGAVLQLDYVTDFGLIWGVRRTNISYTIKNTDIDVDGNSWGIHITGQF